MELSGFFVLTLDEPEKSGGAVGGFSVRFGWQDGSPYLTDLGSGDRILVNDSPIDLNKPVSLQAGDSITLHIRRLGWIRESSLAMLSQLLLPFYPAVR